jgi:electron transfer flavoprotein beta subunit
MNTLHSPSAAVLVGPCEHPVSGRTIRDKGDAVAVGLALSLLPAEQIRLYCAGSLSDAVARDYLALGAQQIKVLEGLDACADNVLPLLVQAVSATHLVITGTRSNGGHGSGLLPYALASALGRPLIDRVVEVRPEGSGWLVLQSLPKGARRSLRVSVPVVLAISPNAAVALRHSHAMAQGGSIERQCLPMTTARMPVADRLEPRSLQLKTLQARTEQSGHARMLKAIGSQGQAGASVTVQTGAARQKAHSILNHLRQHALVDF